jgi:hypothetical protein
VNSKVRNQVLDNYLEHNLPKRRDEFLKKCPECNNLMPLFIANCWYCGEILDQDLIRLVKGKD